MTAGERCREVLKLSIGEFAMEASFTALGFEMRASCRHLLALAENFAAMWLITDERLTQGGNDAGAFEI